MSTFTVELDFGAKWIRKWLRFHPQEQAEVAVEGSEWATPYDSPEIALEAARRFRIDHPGLLRYRVHGGGSVWAWRLCMSMDPG